jgi:hypothetical protein
VSPVLFDEIGEARLLAAMIADEGVMECCGSVDLDYFADARHVAILTAIRDLQQTDTPIDVASVGDEIAMRDMDYDTHRYEFAGHAYLGLLMLEMPTYPSGPILFLNIAWLRKLGERRRALS